MRRDYFTCVFLGLIAGALMFVCFAPPYFIYEGIAPRIFSPFEICMSFLYFLFFVMFLPIWGAYRKKIWINFGLAAYGVLAFLPVFFYPSAEAMVDPGLGTQLKAMLLKGIYSMVQAPFAGVSALMGNNFASKAVYWLLPLSLAWLLIFKAGRFYRNAYLTDRLSAGPEAEAPSEPPLHEQQEPEVLGTVITAPVSAASPADVSRKAASNPPPAPPQPKAEQPAVKPQVRPVHIKAPQKQEDFFDVGEPQAKPATDDVIQLGAPKAQPKTDDVIQLGPPPSKPDDVIILGAPEPPKSGN